MLLNKQDMAYALNTQGATFYIQGNYEQALLYYQKSLAISEDIGDKKLIANANSNIGLVLFDKGSYEQALWYYDKSLKIRQNINLL